MSTIITYHHVEGAINLPFGRPSIGSEIISLLARCPLLLLLLQKADRIVRSDVLQTEYCIKTKISEKLTAS